MSNSCAVFWKNELVGYVSDLSNDMWYYDGRWACADSAFARDFETITRRLDPKHVREFPDHGLLIKLTSDQPFSLSHMLVLGLQGDDLLLRMVSPETAAYVDLDQFSPWQKADRAEFFEAALKRQVGFFHPLRFKSVRAIGMRDDRHDVLFELQDGSQRYALVHLTHKKERSKKLPATEFYKGWKAFYDQELAHLVAPFDIQSLTGSIVEEVEKHGAKYQVTSFDSGAVMIDVWWKDQLYVVQMHEQQLGLSLVTDDNGFSTVPDESFTHAELLLENFKRIFR
ncbi:MAG: hypothetical protein ABW007_12910 [Chitinophagaceae bacterium]